MSQELLQESNHTGNLFCPADAQRERAPNSGRAGSNRRAIFALRSNHARADDVPEKFSTTTIMKPD